jgi:Anti-sigma factor NepR
MKSQKPAAKTAKGPPTSPKPSPRLDRDIQGAIGDQLRAMHDSILREGVPDRFVELLARLDKTQGSR